MKILSTLLAFTVGVSMIQGGEVFKVEKVTDFDGAVKNLSLTKDGALNFKNDTKKGNFHIFSKAKFKVDPAKKYVFSAKVRSKSGKLWIGIPCFDAQNRDINTTAINCIKDSETFLTAPVKKGDRVVKVKDASKWVKDYARP